MLINGAPKDWKEREEARKADRLEVLATGEWMKENSEP